MREDDVLGPVRDHVRRERADDAALEAVARGEIGTAPCADVEGRAATDPEAAALVALSRPLGEAVEARIAARVALDPVGASVKPTAAGPRVVRLASIRSLGRRVAMVAGPLALAAAVLLWVLGGRRGEDGRVRLPDYAVSASSEQAMRGPSDTARSTRLRLRSGASFEIILRPATTAGTKVVVYAFAMGEGEPNPIDAKIEIAPEGAIRIRGLASVLAGAREVRVVVGTANESITRFDDALTRARDGTDGPFVRVLTVPITRE